MEKHLFMYLLVPSNYPNATDETIPPDATSVDGSLRCNAQDADDDVDTCVCVITRYDLIVAI